jgi:hypothetical protein
MKFAWILLLLPLGFPVNANPLTMNSGERQVTLLELYTSQGCSSCPPAERWLNKYVGNDDLWKQIVPIAFHVDYWDYIGWKDILATAGNGIRQRDYARAGKTRTVYTPGFFTNGREWRGWTFGIGPRTSRRQPGNLEVTIDGKQVRAQFPANDNLLKLNIAVLGFGIETNIKRGENRNSVLRQEFVSLAHVAHQSSTGEWRVTLPDYSDINVSRFGVAVWVSRPGNPTPIQTTGGWLE